MRDRMRKLSDSFIQAYGTNPRNILEIGSRDGHDVNILREFCGVVPEKVYVVEPNPRAIPSIKKDYPRFKLFEVAISNSPGTVSFNSIESVDDIDIGQSSLLPRSPRHAHVGGTYINGNNWIKVEAITGSSLLELIGEDIDIVKIDVEGFSYEVLESFGADLKKFKIVQAECETIQFWKDQKLMPEIEQYMEGQGFTKLYSLGYDYPNQYDLVWKNELR